MCVSYGVASRLLALMKIFRQIKRSFEAGISASQLTLANIYAEWCEKTLTTIKLIFSNSSGNQDAQVLLANAIRQGRCSKRYK